MDYENITLDDPEAIAEFFAAAKEYTDAIPAVAGSYVELMQEAVGVDQFKRALVNAHTNEDARAVCESFWCDGMDTGVSMCATLMGVDLEKDAAQFDLSDPRVVFVWNAFWDCVLARMDAIVTVMRVTADKINDMPAHYARILDAAICDYDIRSGSIIRGEQLFGTGDVKPDIELQTVITTQAADLYAQRFAGLFFNGAGRADVVEEFDETIFDLAADRYAVLNGSPAADGAIAAAAPDSKLAKEFAAIAANLFERKIREDVFAWRYSA